MDKIERQDVLLAGLKQLPNFHDGGNYMSMGRNPKIYLGQDTRVKIVKSTPIEVRSVLHDERMLVERGELTEYSFTLTSDSFYGFKCSASLFDAEYLFIHLTLSPGRYKEMYIGGLRVTFIESHLSMTDDKPGTFKLEGQFNTDREPK